MQLRGLNVVITRPEDAGKALANELQLLGAHVVHEPMYFIEPMLSQAYAKSFINIKPDLCLATSVHAVNTAGAYISKHHKSWLNKVPVIGIGPATAGALHAQGWHDVSYPKVFNSEGILAMRVMQRVRGKTVMLLTGAQGRNLLNPELSARGAHVIQVDGYQRQMQQQISLMALDQLAKQPVLVVLTSVEAWQTLERLVSPINPQLLTKAILVVASKRIAEVIWQGYRHQQIVIAANASQESILVAIVSWFKEKFDE